MKVAFIHGRPASHPFHDALLHAVGADFIPVDFLLRWHGIPASRPRRYLSWLLCALGFPHQRYDVLVSGGLHFPPVLMKQLGLLRPDQRIAALMADQTLFFLREGRYPRATAAALRWALRRYDALLCIGRMQADLAREALASGDGDPPSADRPVVLTLPSAVSPARAATLPDLVPDLAGRRLVFIGHGAAPWRAHYKGLDLLLQTFARCLDDPALAQLSPALDIVGAWSPASLAGLKLPAPGVRFLGPQPDIAQALSSAALYVHLGRGEAFGISVLEAMLAGVPALVSTWTGAREAVEQVDPLLVVPLDPRAAAERIRWYLLLPPPRKQALSARARQVAARYSTRRAETAMFSALHAVVDHCE